MAVQSLKAILGTLTSFIANYINNPPPVTAAQLGVYTQAEIDKLLQSKLGLGDTPISYWGQSMGDAVNMSITGTVLRFNTPMPALLGGARAVLPVDTLNVSAVNGTATYVYLIASNGQLMYAGSATVIPEDSVSMYIGKTVGNGTTAVLTDFKPVIRMGSYRLSNSRRGSAIPVSDASGNIAW